MNSSTVDMIGGLFIIGILPLAILWAGYAALVVWLNDPVDRIVPDWARLSSIQTVAVIALMPITAPLFLVVMFLVILSIPFQMFWKV